MATIFVYGTLLEGCRNHDRLLTGRVRSIQTAYVKGTLYSLKGVDYPALVDGDSFIRGEQMEVADDVLPLLDELEGYRGENDPMNMYHKVWMDIYDEDQIRRIKLPVYVYNIDRPDQRDALDTVITEQDYRQWLKHRFG